MSIVRAIRRLMPRKFGRCMGLVAICMVIALFVETFLFESRTNTGSDQMGDPRHLNPRHVAKSSPVVSFALQGESSEFPSQWNFGKKDPFFNLTLVGGDNSPGQNGAEVVHVGAEVEEAKRRFKENNFDTVASEKVPLDRRVKDLRHPDCLNIQYDQDLPSTSIIVIFYNEAPSVLLRTVISVLNRTPLKFVKEVILVDDHSDIKSNVDVLPNAIRTFFPPMVKLVRNEKRLGLIKARMAGSDKASGDIILFLDSHCEVGPGWLEPLLQRIKEDYRNVVMPSHDIIKAEGFEFVGASTIDNQGVFNWGLLHIWQGLPDFDKEKIKLKSDPVRSPTMAGGLFAISKKWWEYLGKYDPGFEVWGGENVELSFKTWMCGGRLDIMPCSHVGHVFRGGSPYPAHVKNSMSINQKRLADVWLDEYKEIVYLRHPELKTLDAGNISSRVALRKSLNCRSFKWYMENVVPDKYVPSLKLKAGGGIKTSEKCVDTMQKETGEVALYPACHYTGSQNFQMTAKDEIRHGVDACLEADLVYQKIVLAPCSGKVMQSWSHSGAGTPIQSKANSEYCAAGVGDSLLLYRCDAHDSNQAFTFKEYYNAL